MPVQTHSEAAIAKYPAPNRDSFSSPEEYAQACKQINDSREAYDVAGLTTSQKLDRIGEAAIIERVMNADFYEDIAKDSGGSRHSLRIWLDARPDMYARARKARAEKLAEDIIQISDDGTNDYMEKLNQKGEFVGYTVNGENIQRSKLRVDTRKWAASKMFPEKFGDKLALGGDPEAPPIMVAHTVTSPEYFLTMQEKLVAMFAKKGKE